MTFKPNGMVVTTACTAIVLASIAYVGKATMDTHDGVIKLQSDYSNMKSDIDTVKINMITKTDFENRLSMELLKLQIPVKK